MIPTRESRNALMTILKAGGTIEFGRVTICDISRYVNFSTGKRKWQVTSDDYRKQFSELYADMNEAIDVFLNILRVTKG